LPPGGAALYNFLQHALRNVRVGVANSVLFLFRGGGGRGVCAVIERERERERGLEPNAENLMANVYDAP
jgi:hypothetical protein